MGVIIFNGRSSEEVGLEVETYPSYASPKRSYETIQVPGRNGTIYIDNGSWENVKRTYQVSVGSRYRDYTKMVNRISEWLHSTFTYARLEDTYEPEYYRMALFLDEIEFSNIYNQGGQAELSFDCKPQRFLKIGEEPIICTETRRIVNPTSFASSPIIRVYGTGAGEVTLGDYRAQFSIVDTEVILDSETQDVYFQNQNKNDTVTLERGFPKFEPGEQAISFSGSITKVEVIPKWFTI